MTDDEIADLDKAFARLCADAARYRWLRSEEVRTEPKYYPFWAEENYKLTREKRLDELIDEWMTKE